jgi:hypothetical protein
MILVGLIANVGRRVSIVGKVGNVGRVGFVGRIGLVDLVAYLGGRRTLQD